MLRFSALLLVVVFAAGEERTVFKWSRKLETCDAQDLPLKLGPQKLLYAYSDQRPEQGTDITKHTHKGAKSMRLFSVPELPDLEPDRKSFDIAMPAMEIPFNHPDPTTMYYCRSFQLPTADEQEDTHVIGWEPLIDATNRDIVHHILIYECPGLVGEEIGNHGACHGHPSTLLPNVSKCNGQTFVAGWAVGGGPIYFPKHVGLPMGPNQTHFVLMEIHYNNQAGRSVVDSSGIRFWRTWTKRQFEAGNLVTGQFTDDQWVIPPGTVTDWSTWCPSECSREWLPPTGIKLLGTTLHAHIHATAISLQLVAENGTELVMLHNEDPYDFNFQDYEIFMDEVTMMPGDRLKTTCRYDTTNRATGLPFGLGTTDEEMCLAFTFYYPRVGARDIPGGCQFGDFSGIGAPNTTLAVCGDKTVFPVDTRLTTPLPEPPCNYTAPDPNRTQAQPLKNFDRNAYDRHEFMDADNKFQLHWRIDRDGDVAHFAAEVATTGWVGFGISDNGDMAGADIVVGWAAEDGFQPNASDRMATAHSRPPVDAFEDIFDVEVGTITVGSPAEANRTLLIVLGSVGGVVALVAFACCCLRKSSAKRHAVYGRTDETKPNYQTLEE